MLSTKEGSLSVWRCIGWLAVGFLASFGLVAGFSLGIFAWPLLAVLLVVMNTIGRSRESDRGVGWAALAGIGLCSGIVFAINPEWWPLLPTTLVLLGLGVTLPIVVSRQHRPFR